MYTQKPSALFRRYAVPQMVGLLLNSVYLIVDGVFIGNRLGREAMAAAAVSVPVIEILIALALAVSSGAGILISRHLGNKQAGEANQVFNLSVVVLAALGLVIATLGNLLLGPLARLLGATPDIYADATGYLRIILTFSPFLLFSFLLSGIVRNDNRPKLAMAALAVGSASNILLDWLFMYPLDMGIAGAALATALGPILSILMLLPHFLRRRGRLFFSKHKSPPRTLPLLAKLGLPAFIMEFSIGIVTFIYNFFIIRCGYGEMGLAAYLIIGYIALIVLTLFLGAAQGLQPLFSYWQGEGHTGQSAALLAFARKMLPLLGLGCYILVVLFARGFIAIFAPADTELVAFTYQKCLVYFSGFFFAGYNVLMISYWQAVQRAGSALWLALLRSAVTLPLLALALPAIWGIEALWACQSLAEAVAAAVAVVLSRPGGRRRAAHRAHRA